MPLLEDIIVEKLTPMSTPMFYDLTKWSKTI